MESYKCLVAQTMGHYHSTERITPRIWI